MKKSLLLFLCSIVSTWQYIYAENSESVYDDSEEVFEYVDLEEVPTGILVDYGIHLVAPELYNGTTTESNYVTDFIWKSLYAGIQSSVVNNKCDMQESSDVFETLDKKNATGIMYYKYNTFADDALERGLVTFEDEKIRIVPGKPSPYIEKECFAVMPPEGSLPKVFDKSNFYSNTGLDVTKVEYKIDNSSYRIMPFTGHAFRELPISPGEYNITFRVTFSNGKTMESHSMITIEPEVPDIGKEPVMSNMTTFSITADNKQSGGTIQVKYMNNSPAKGKFVRPLIIVEDMDLSSLSNSLSINMEKILSIDGMEELSQLYDIVYIDFNDGLDDLLRNGEVLRRALAMINQNRYDDFSDNSYIVGLGTGGVISRIAVNLMENSNENHKVQKIISVNSPFRGINIPVALQMLILQGEEFTNAISGHKHFEFAKGLFDKYVNLLGRRAISQLLIYKIVNFNINNTEHNLFLQNTNVLKRPNSCESIVISNGNNHYSYLYRPYYEIMNIDYTKKEGLGGFWSGGAEIEVKAFAIPNKQIAEIYNGAMRRFKIRCGVKKNFDQNYRVLNSTSNMHPADDASGSYFETAFANSIVSGLSGFGNVMNVDKFCFVPTFSALDLDAEKYFAADDLKDLRGEMNADRAYWTGSNDSYPGLSGSSTSLCRSLPRRLRARPATCWAT